MKFYSQQIAATLAIVGLWVVVIFALTRPTQPVEQVPVQDGPAKIVREPREEATGESMRVHHLDAYGQKTQMDVTFKDGTAGQVSYDSLGRIRKIVETSRNGSYQVFTFANGRLNMRQSFTKDGKLRQETVPADKALQTTHYAADGKTRTLVQRRFADGTVEADLYWEDGKTLRAQLKSAAPVKVNDGGTEVLMSLSGTLTTYTRQGVRYSQESYETKPSQCGNPMCHECGGSEQVEVHIHRADGSLWIRQNWDSQYGNSTVTGQEYAADGQTVVRELNPNEVQSGSSSKVIVEQVEAKKLLRFLNYEGKMERQVTENPDGTTEEISVPKEKQAPLDLELIKYGLQKNDLLPLMVVPEDAHHLQQMLSR